MIAIRNSSRISGSDCLPAWCVTYLSCSDFSDFFRLSDLGGISEQTWGDLLRLIDLWSVFEETWGGWFRLTDLWRHLWWELKRLVETLEMLETSLKRLIQTHRPRIFDETWRDWCRLSDWWKPLWGDLRRLVEIRRSKEISLRRLEETDSDSQTYGDLSGWNWGDIFRLSAQWRHLFLD